MNISEDSPELIETRRVFASNSAEINALYAEHVPNYLKDLNAAFVAGDTEAVSFQAHKMCSAMKTIGFQQPAELLETIERTPEDEKLVSEHIQSVYQLVMMSLSVLKSRNAG